MKARTPVLRARLAGAFWPALLLLQACGGCPPSTPITTHDFSPVLVTTGSSGIMGSIGFCLSMGQIPATTFSAAAPQMMVGYDDFFRAGTNPLPCDDLRVGDFRGLVKFDTAQFDVIAAAELLFDTQRSIDRSNGEVTGTLPPVSYATTYGVSIANPSSDMPDTDQQTLPRGPSISVDVGRQVGDWVAKTRPNFGFVIGGPRGPIDRDDPPEDNDAKVSWYGNFRLRVTYNPALNPRAPQ